MIRWFWRLVPHEPQQERIFTSYETLVKVLPDGSLTEPVPWGFSWVLSTCRRCGR